MSMIVQIGSFSGFVNGETPEPTIRKGNIEEIAAHVVSLTPVYSKAEMEKVGTCGKFLEKLVNGVYYTFACPSKVIYCSLANALHKALNFNKEKVPALASELSEDEKLKLQGEIEEMKRVLSRRIEDGVPARIQLRQILLIVNAEIKLKDHPAILSEENKLKLQGEIEAMKKVLFQMIVKDVSDPFQLIQILLILNAEIKLKDDPSTEILQGIKKLIKGIENQEDEAKEEALEFIFPASNH